MSDKIYCGSAKARDTRELYWCNEGCGFVDKNHRCEQWCTLTIIPIEALETYQNGKGGKK